MNVHVEPLKDDPTGKKKPNSESGQNEELMSKGSNK